ncbi:cell wall metabolism sensor histidine kinase WalK [Paenibacillus sp. YN15]|uniref:sensor histidine kinase n=1 Tax=Paenibacillus sp. YN15 TaxID=1742774 RepID=UPI000DCC540C|nr:HAMP domain-containing sensor histidine kinase [Paenibacillus sp. YN15]RAV01791.1 two-component sensor histidine kinase [Paenibacillus sp. YN15]
MKTLARRMRRLVVPHSLRYQLVTRSLLIMAVLLLSIGVFQYWFMKNFLYKNQAEAMFTQMNSVPRELVGAEPMPDRKDRQNQGQRLEKLPGVNGGAPAQNQPAAPADSSLEPVNGEGRRPYFFLPDTALATVDINGNVTRLSEEGGHPMPSISKEQYAEILQEVKANNKPQYWVADGSDGSGRQLVVFRSTLGAPGRTGDTFIQMSIPTSSLDDTVLQQLMIFVVLSAAALLAGIGLYLPVIRRTLVPLSRMVSAVQRTDAGTLNERLPIGQGQEEIDQLANSFNGMLKRLDDSFRAEREAKEQMARFIADASHELRTPLTSIHGFLEVLLRGAMNNPGQLQSALSSMHGESKRINKLVEDLLLLAKLDRAPQLTFKDTALDELIREMEPQLRMLAGKREVLISVQPKVQGVYDPDKIKQVVLNLFHNAVQHTDPETGRISLTLAARKDSAELSVRDNGPGIPEEHLPHVFDRFYRSESSRTRRSGGAGLGLSISKSLVEAHGGDIWVESAVGEGTTFALRLPRKQG